MPWKYLNRPQTGQDVDIQTASQPRKLIYTIHKSKLPVASHTTPNSKFWVPDVVLGGFRSPSMTLAGFLGYYGELPPHRIPLDVDEPHKRKDEHNIGIVALSMLQSLRSGPEGTRGRNLVTIIKVDDF